MFFMVKNCCDTNCLRDFILCLLDRVFDTCDVPPELRTSIENQVTYELDFSLYGGVDDTN